MGGLTPMTPASNWLAQLAPDHAPPPPGWWPPAPGWWLLAALLIAFAIGLVLWWRNPRRRLRQAALRELARVGASTGNSNVIAAGIENVLRRFALAHFGQARVARLSGEAWLAFLVAEGADSLSGGPGRSLIAAAYGGQVPDARALWLAGARRFVQRAGRRRRRTP